MTTPLEAREILMYPDTAPFEARRPEFEPERQPIDEMQTQRAATVSGAGARKLARSRPGPPRYKLALLTWAGAYAVITLLLTVLGPAMATWPLGLRTLVLSALMVVLLTWLVVPALTRLLRNWLMRMP
jgi:antibiotic biosynthesis monooxygenase (ABM) superfamily enzyme